MRDDGHRWVGTLTDQMFSPCQICGRPLSKHKGNQLPPNNQPSTGASNHE